MFSMIEHLLCARGRHILGIEDGIRGVVLRVGRGALTSRPLDSFFFFF